MIKRYFRVFGLLMLLTPLFACRQNSTNKVDEFYTEKGEWDSARIPFIKPYEAVIFGKKEGWGMSLHSFEGEGSMISHIREATVVNGFVLVHTDRTLLNGIEIKQSWWVVSPSRKIEKGFSDHHEFWTSLKTLGFDEEPRLHDVEIIAWFYEDHDTMDWDEVGISASKIQNNIILFSQNGSK